MSSCGHHQAPLPDVGSIVRTSRAGAFDFDGERFLRKFDASKFLLPVPNEMIEFNAFKYAPAGDGLVELHFARRVTIGEIDAEELFAIRRRAIKEMADDAMGPLRTYFGK